MSNFFCTVRVEHQSSFPSLLTFLTHLTHLTPLLRHEPCLISANRGWLWTFLANPLHDRYCLT
jgi:hypothetical protein